MATLRELDELPDDIQKTLQKTRVGNLSDSIEKAVPVVRAKLSKVREEREKAASLAQERLRMEESLRQQASAAAAESDAENSRAERTRVVLDKILSEVEAWSLAKSTVEEEQTKLEAAVAEGSRKRNDRVDENVAALLESVKVVAPGVGRRGSDRVKWADACCAELKAVLAQMSEAAEKDTAKKNIGRLWLIDACNQSCDKRFASLQGFVRTFTKADMAILFPPTRNTYRTTAAVLEKRFMDTVFEVDEQNINLRKLPILSASDSKVVHASLARKQQAVERRDTTNGARKKFMAVESEWGLSRLWNAGVILDMEQPTQGYKITLAKGRAQTEASDSEVPEEDEEQKDQAAVEEADEALVPADSEMCIVSRRMLNESQRLLQRGPAFYERLIKDATLDKAGAPLFDEVWVIDPLAKIGDSAEGTIRVMTVAADGAGTETEVRPNAAGVKWVGTDPDDRSTPFLSLRVQRCATAACEGGSVHRTFNEQALRQESDGRVAAIWENCKFQYLSLSSDSHNGIRHLLPPPSAQTLASMYDLDPWWTH